MKGPVGRRIEDIACQHFVTDADCSIFRKSSDLLTIASSLVRIIGYDKKKNLSVSMCRFYKGAFDD